MKKPFVSIIGLLLTLRISMTGCGGSPEISESASSAQIEEQSSSITQEDKTSEDAVSYTHLTLPTKLEV